jgi:hypothetical protein
MGKWGLLTSGFLLGFVCGGFVGYLNRPKYLFGLYRPGLDDITRSGFLFADVMTPVVTYGFVGGMLGLIAAAVLCNSRGRGE